MDVQGTHLATAGRAGQTRRSARTWWVPSVFAFAAALLVAASACSQEAEQPSAPPPAPPPAQKSASVEPPLRPDRVPLVKGELSPDGLQAILGTGDLGVGRNRVGFVLISRQGFVTEPEITVSSRYFSESASDGELVETTSAELKPWPYGSRGLYATHLTFDSPGSWGIDIVVQGSAGAGRRAQLRFEVAPSTSAPAVGSAAIRSMSKTVGDVETLGQLTTGSLQDPDLYRTTIAEAVTSGMPAVIVFASPAFCTNEVCGPQVDVLQEIKDEFKGKGHFVHVDFYDNPQEIQGDLNKARLSPAVLEWGLPSIEWTFVVDRSGVVTARFEGFATLEEVREALLKAL